MLRPETPLIDLHCHIEGSIDPDQSFEILHRAGHPEAQDRAVFMERVTGYKWAWEGFEAAIHLLDRCLMDRATVMEVVSDIVARAAEENVVILEPTFIRTRKETGFGSRGSSPIGGAAKAGRRCQSAFWALVRR